jgi:Chitin binding Peritrophin-A domain
MKLHLKIPAEGNLIQHSCSSGIYFNPETLQCDFPQNVQCRLSRIIVPQTPLVPDCTSGANFFPNLVNCKQYYMCVKNQPVIMNCRKGELWNNLKLRCDKSESEICARQFDNFLGAFLYSKPNEDEKKN